MRWKIVLEGTDEFGSAHRSELTIDKDLECVSAGEIGFSVEDGKTIMAHLQQVVVNQQCEAYVLTSRFCMDCERFRRIKDYGKRKIRTVFGCVEVRNPRIMNSYVHSQSIWVRRSDRSAWLRLPYDGAIARGRRQDRQDDG